jgi:hypothetical protein
MPPRCRYGQVDDSFIPTDRETGEFRCPQAALSRWAATGTAHHNPCNGIPPGCYRFGGPRQSGPLPPCRRISPPDSHTHAGRPRGFGFVTMEANAANQAMMELNNTGERA